jgi:hypothetical protein
MQGGMSGLKGDPDNQDMIVHAIDPLGGARGRRG